MPGGHYVGQHVDAGSALGLVGLLPQAATHRALRPPPQRGRQRQSGPSKWSRIAALRDAGQSSPTGCIRPGGAVRGHVPYLWLPLGYPCGSGLHRGQIRRQAPSLGRLPASRVIRSSRTRLPLFDQPASGCDGRTARVQAPSHQAHPTHLPANPGWGRGLRPSRCSDALSLERLALIRSGRLLVPGQPGRIPMVRHDAAVERLQCGWWYPRRAVVPVRAGGGGVLG